MSANIEHALLTAIMLQGDFHSVEKAQIDETYFSTSEAREVYRYLKEIYHAPGTTGAVPSVQMTQHRFPSFYPVQVFDSVAILTDQLRRERVRLELLGLSQSLQEMADRDPIAAMAELRAEAAKISSLATVGEDLPMSAAYQMLLSQYDMVSESGGIIGIPYPWDAVNEETQGMQNGQFIILFGRPKSMKTWVATYMACDAYLRSRRRVLVYTREMSPQLMAMRIAATLARVDYKAFKNGKLQPDVKTRTFEILQDLLDDEKAAGAHGYRQPYLIVTTDRSARMSGAGGGVGWLQAKIRDLQPDIVFVDGMYLMRDDRTNQRTIDWKAIAHISQDLKLTAQEFDIPIIGITQANRNSEKSKGEDLTELAFSDSLGQDADAVFRVSKESVIDEITKHKRTELHLKAPGLREGVFDGIVIRGEPATSFEFLRIIKPEEENSEREEYGDRQKGSDDPARQGTFRRRPQQFADPKIPAPGSRR